MDIAITSVLKRGRLFGTALLSVVVLVVVFFSSFLGSSTPQPIFVRQELPTLKSISTPSRPPQPKWQSELLKNSTETPSDDIALNGLSNALSQGIAVSYNALQQSGNLTPENAERVANNMAESLRLEPVFTSYTQKDVTIATDVSYQGMLKYRSAMRVALEPLLANRDAEFEVYAHYIESKNPLYLTRLAEAAVNYRKAIDGALKVTVPTDAQEQHLRSINALLQFATVLEDIAKHASDPLASVVLLRTYNVAETEVFASFNELARYYSTKKNV